MTATRLRPLFVAFSMLFVLAWSQDTPAAARLIVKALEPFPVGAPVDVDVALLGNEDRPLSNNVLELYLDGEYVRRIRTAEDGTAKLRISRDLGIGNYTVNVRFIGTQAYSATEVSAPLVVRPAFLTIETVPPLADIEFALGEQRFSSDAQGVARLELYEAGTYALKLLSEPEALHTADTKISFARWNDAVFTPERLIDFGNRDLSYQVGFELSHPVETTFIDLGDDTVDWSRVSSLTLKSSSAAYRTITQAEQPYWLQANRIMRQRSGIFPTPLLWSVESVMLDGSNVVNRYQQRFYVEPNAIWQVRLLLYQARIRSRDAFFGFSVGDGVAVTYPDGKAEDLVFDDNNEVSIINMARGLYKLQVIGASGVAPLTPVAMTKDQDVVLKVLSGFDIGALIVSGLALAFGLLFFGRPHLIGLRQHVKQPLSVFETLSGRRPPKHYGSSLLEAPLSKPGRSAQRPATKQPSSAEATAPDAPSAEGRALIDTLVRSANSVDWVGALIAAESVVKTPAESATETPAKPAAPPTLQATQTLGQRVLKWLEVHVGLERTGAHAPPRLQTIAVERHETLADDDDTLILLR